MGGMMCMEELNAVKNLSSGRSPYARVSGGRSE